MRLRRRRRRTSPTFPLGLMPPYQTLQHAFDAERDPSLEATDVLIVPRASELLIPLYCRRCGFEVTLPDWRATAAHALGAPLLCVECAVTLADERPEAIAFVVTVEEPEMLEGE